MQEMESLRLRQVGMFMFTQQVCNMHYDKAVSSEARMAFSVTWLHWSVCFRTTDFLEGQMIGATIIVANIC